MTDKNLQALKAFAEAVAAACTALEKSGVDVGLGATAKLIDAGNRLASNAYRVHNAVDRGESAEALASKVSIIGKPPAVPASRGTIR